MTNINISARKAYAITQEIFKDIEKSTDYNISFSFDETQEVSAGANIHNQSNIQIKVGCQNLLKEEYWKNKPFEKISLSDFTTLLVVAGHERQHAQQELEFLHEDNEVILKMAIESAAQFQNPQYYNETYQTNICEIDAERQGIIDAYQVLSQQYDEKTAENQILEYIKKRQENNGQYFISQEPKSMQEAVDIFNQAFRKNYENKPFFVYKDLEGRKKDNFVNELWTKQYRMRDSCFNDVTDGWEQRQYMIATSMQYGFCNVHLHQDNILRRQPWIDNYNEMPSKQKVMQVAREEAQQLCEAATNPDTFKGRPVSPAMQAVMNGTGITDALLTYGASCNHSAEVLKSITYITDGLADKLHTVDEINLLHWKARMTTQNSPDKSLVVATINPMANQKDVFVCFYQNGMEIGNTIQPIQELNINSNEANIVSTTLNGVQYQFKLDQNYPEFTLATLDMVKEQCLANNNIVRTDYQMQAGGQSYMRRFGERFTEVNENPERRIESNIQQQQYAYNEDELEKLKEQIRQELEAEGPVQEPVQDKNINEREEAEDSLSEQTQTEMYNSLSQEKEKTYIKNEETKEQVTELKKPEEEKQEKDLTKIKKEETKTSDVNVNVISETDTKYAEITADLMYDSARQGIPMNTVNQFAKEMTKTSAIESQEHQEQARQKIVSEWKSMNFKLQEMSYSNPQDFAEKTLKMVKNQTNQIFQQYILAELQNSLPSSKMTPVNSQSDIATYKEPADAMKEFAAKVVDIYNQKVEINKNQNLTQNLVKNNTGIR